MLNELFVTMVLKLQNFHFLHFLENFSSPLGAPVLLYFKSAKTCQQNGVKWFDQFWLVFFDFKSYENRDIGQQQNKGFPKIF